MEKLVVGEVGKLEPGKSLLTIMCNEDGGIIDDCIVTNAGDHLHVVVNGACKDGDLKHMQQHAPAGVTLEMLSSQNTALVALQGPKAAASLKTLLPSNVDLTTMDFMTCREEIMVAGVKCRLSRCGYTGEDGFEISTSDNPGKMYDALLSCPDVAPAGLGARDSLRLEAGLCLYGHDMNDKTRPVEAGLAWLIPKSRRETKNFIGAAKVLEQLEKPDTLKNKRVGFMIPIGAPAREDTPIFAENPGKDGFRNIGKVTSGTFSPTLKKPLGMGYVSAPYSKFGTEVFMEVRGKKIKAVVSKMPFVPTHYYRAPGQ
jgi:aminomethyltransferase